MSIESMLCTASRYSDTVEKAIIDYAKKNNVDVMIIGTTGMSAVEEIFVGSVAN
jgi:nucleotide-binding universal stress UspA family protein